MSLSDFEKLEVNDSAKSYLLETAKWGKFLAIAGFILSGILVLFGVFFGTIYNGMMNRALGESQAAPQVQGMGFFMGAMYVAIAAIYLIPCFYLFKFSKKAKTAVEDSDASDLEEAFLNQKSMFKFFGIFTIVILAIYGIAILFAIIGGGIFAFMK
ncbi:MAG: hypothetical protein IPP61_06600 [Cytophagaceae bacterium]|nr:hypothetical protein [Cytophagaceae bacterium]MBL0324835.1 hypothetical protein [Cytophagaceae bacterium]